MPLGVKAAATMNLYKKWGRTRDCSVKSPASDFIFTLTGKPTSDIVSAPSCLEACVWIWLFSVSKIIHRKFCDLLSTYKELFSVFTALFPSGSVYRDEFDLAILKLQEDNRLEILKRKWWDGGKCPKEEDHRAKGLICLLREIRNVNNHHLYPLFLFFSSCAISSGLGMENIGGIFVVLVCGLLVAIFMAVLEFVWMLKQAPGNEVRKGNLTWIYLPLKRVMRFCTNVVHLFIYFSS